VKRRSYGKKNRTTFFRTTDVVVCVPALSLRIGCIDIIKAYRFHSFNVALYYNLTLKYMFTSPYRPTFYFFFVCIILMNSETLLQIVYSFSRHRPMQFYFLAI
jgi:hypothetical protein